MDRQVGTTSGLVFRQDKAAERQREEVYPFDGPVLLGYCDGSRGKQVEFVGTLIAELDKEYAKAKAAHEAAKS